MYKRAVDDLRPSERLINDTAEKMRHTKTSARRTSLSVRYAVVGSLAVAIAGTIALPSILHPVTGNRTPFEVSQPPTNTPDGAIGEDDPSSPSPNRPQLPQIRDHYVPFQATEYEAVKAMGPHYPLSYEELRQHSDLVLLATVSDVGVYRSKAEQYHPKASFGTYIYTVSIDRILSGSPDEDVGSLIPVSEWAWADPVYEETGDVISAWSFRPYSVRPKEARTLERDQQVVLFLSRNDDTGVYRISYDGFGAFPVEYIEQEARKNTLGELQQQYEYVEKTGGAPMENDLLFRLSGFYVKEEFLR